MNKKKDEPKVVTSKDILAQGSPFVYSFLYLQFLMISFSSFADAASSIQLDWWSGWRTRDCHPTSEGRYPRRRCCRRRGQDPQPQAQSSGPPCRRYHSTFLLSFSAYVLLLLQCLSMDLPALPMAVVVLALTRRPAQQV